MGDPAAALLELFDSEQNKYFTDHYLEIPFDFSEVFFITTANTLDTIPEPLLDRMEVIEISGYTIEEKKNIARQYLLPKKEKEAGISEVKGVEIKWGMKAIGDIIDLYTRESGVRNLEKAISKIIRKIAREIVADMDNSSSRGKIIIDNDALVRYLGKPKFLKDAIDKKPEVGVVTGLAWTPFGGTVLEIETSSSPGSGELIMTGQLGDVMKESVTIAIGYIRSRGADFGLPADYFDKHDINIHVPEGAVKKDGPSAGVTIFAALVSCLTNIKAKKSIAMTGEITLRGKITAVGGIKEKVLAAFRLGIRRIILPKENEVDVDEIPEKERKKIEIIYIEEASEALDVALQKNPL
jgi:ATP-dependent Lon protease